MAQSLNTPRRLLRRTEVEARTGLSRSAIYARISGKRPDVRDEDFPKPIVIDRCKDGSPRTVAWIEAEVDAWIEAKIQATRSLKAA